MTDLGAVLAQLKKERDKLNQAIAALSGAVEVDDQRGAFRGLDGNESPLLNGHAGRT